MLFVACFPILILTLSSTVPGILSGIAGYVLICGILQHQYGNTKKSFNNRVIAASVILELILVFIFTQHWLPSSVVTVVANKIHISNLILVILGGIALGIMSFYGMCKLLTLISDYISDTENTKLIKWIKSDTISCKQKVILSIGMAMVLFVSQISLPIYIDNDNYGIERYVWFG